MLKPRLALIADQRVRVLALGHQQEADLAPILHERQGHLHCPPGGLSTGAVAIKAEHHAGGSPEQALQVRRRGCRSQGGDSVVDPILGQANNVHITLHHHRLIELTHLAPRTIQAIQLGALVKQGRFRRVEVFRLTLADHPPAETNQLAAMVLDRKHDSPAKTVVMAPIFFFNGQARLGQQFLCARLSAQHPDQVVPAFGSKTHAKHRCSLAVQAPLLEVIDHLTRIGMLLELLLVPARGPFNDVMQLGNLLPCLVIGLRIPRHLQTDPGSQCFHRVQKLHVVIIHQEADGGAVRSTTEAVIKLLGRADVEGGRFLVVEGAAGSKLRARPLQRHTGVDQLGDICSGYQLVDELFGYSAHTGDSGKSVRFIA